MQACRRAPPGTAASRACPPFAAASIPLSACVILRGIVFVRSFCWDAMIHRLVPCLVYVTKTISQTCS